MLWQRVFALRVIMTVLGLLYLFQFLGDVELDFDHGDQTLVIGASHQL